METRKHDTNLETPFILNRARNGEFHAIWLECFCGYRKEDRSDAISNASYWGKLLPNQNVQEWRRIEECRTCRKPRAPMIGLFELLRAGVLNEGDTGEAYLVKDGFGRLGVWADSEGAAKRYLQEPTERVSKQLKELMISHV